MGSLKSSIYLHIIAAVLRKTQSCQFDTTDKNRVWIIQCAPNYKDCMGLHLEQADGIAV